jgi:hypothetical protein
MVRVDGYWEQAWPSYRIFITKPLGKPPVGKPGIIIEYLTLI